jgi:hypothetical protein
MYNVSLLSQWHISYDVVPLCNEYILIKMKKKRRGTTQGCLYLLFLFNIVLEIVARKRNKRHSKVGKEEVKWSLFRDDLILCVEKTKNPTVHKTDRIN